METLQHKTAIHAKNEFEAYLDSTFSAAGAVVVDAKIIPPPPPKPAPPPKVPKPPKPPMEIPAWLKPNIQFETSIYSYPALGIGLSPTAFVLNSSLIISNFYGLIDIGYPFSKENNPPADNDLASEESNIPGRVVFGYLLKYNDYFYIPIDIGFSLSMNGSNRDTPFTFSTGIMKIWRKEKAFKLYTSAKVQIGNDTENCLNNTVLISAGFIIDWVKWLY